MTKTELSHKEPELELRSQEPNKNNLLFLSGYMLTSCFCLSLLCSFGWCPLLAHSQTSPASTLYHSVQVPTALWLTQSDSNLNILQKEDLIGSVKLMDRLLCNQCPYFNLQDYGCGRGIGIFQMVWTWLSRFIF